MAKKSGLNYDVAIRAAQDRELYNAMKEIIALGPTPKRPEDIKADMSGDNRQQNLILAEAEKKRSERYYDALAEIYEKYPQSVQIDIEKSTTETTYAPVYGYSSASTNSYVTKDLYSSKLPEVIREADLTRGLQNLIGTAQNRDEATRQLTMIVGHLEHVMKEGRMSLSGRDEESIAPKIAALALAIKGEGDYQGRLRTAQYIESYIENHDLDHSVAVLNVARETLQPQLDREVSPPQPLVVSPPAESPAARQTGEGESPTIEPAPRAQLADFLAPVHKQALVRASLELNDGDKVKDSVTGERVRNDAHAFTSLAMALNMPELIDKVSDKDGKIFVETEGARQLALLSASAIKDGTLSEEELNSLKAVAENLKICEIKPGVQDRLGNTESIAIAKVGDETVENVLVQAEEAVRKALASDTPDQPTSPTALNTTKQNQISASQSVGV